MKYVYHDGGREAAGFKGVTGDCVTRAIAIVTGLSYSRIYNDLSHGSRTQRLTSRSYRMQSARAGVFTSRQWFKDYMRGLGFSWTPTMGIATGCTVHLADGELPSGRLVVSVSKHYTAVIEGVVYDAHDPQRDTGRCVYGYWTLRPIFIQRQAE